ncbi:MAG TPA: HEAT repeat domain-containing protein [Candidatus Angelobacter sp.]|nr:HEAT repeat domain-containing protein [Candidatus Angelobacter sp.]
MKRRYQRATLVAIGVIALVFLLAILLRPREPAYQGKRLSQWMEDFDGDQETEDRAMVAVKAIGTNAVPFLLDVIRAKEPVWEPKLVWLEWKLMGLSGHREPWPGNTPTFKHQMRAIMAFQALGSSAEVAIPELTVLLQAEDTAGHAALALASIGSNAVPSLATALTNSNAKIRAFTAIALGGVSSESTTIVPLLIHSLKDDSYSVRGMAARSLGELRQFPELVVPALLEALQETNIFVRSSSAWALGRLGAPAKAAVPALLKAQSDPEEQVSRAAAYALKQIDPQVASKTDAK